MDPLIKSHETRLENPPIFRQSGKHHDPEKTSAYEGATETPAPVPERLRTLARDVRRLSPSIRDPERFHVDKDEAAHELERIAADLEGRR